MEYQIPRDSHGRFLGGIKRGTAPKEVRDKIANSNRGKKISQETIQKSKDSIKKKINGGWINSAWYKKDITLTEEHKSKLSKSAKLRVYSKEGEARRNKKISETSKERWSNKEWKDNQIKLILNSLLKRPTSYERKVSELCFKNNLPFIYKGNGNFLINYKNPDFVNEKDKIVIEVFYSYFKTRDYGSVENYKKFCKQKYNSAGWNVLFIDELDLNREDWEEVCLNKIKSCEVLQ